MSAPKAAKGSSKTDAMRAQREEQHKRMMEERAQREKDGAREQALAAADEIADVFPKTSARIKRALEEMPLTFKLWKQACDALIGELNQGVSINWGEVETAAEAAFEEGKLPSVFVAEVAAHEDNASKEDDEEEQGTP